MDNYDIFAQMLSIDILVALLILNKNITSEHLSSDSNVMIRTTKGSHVPSPNQIDYLGDDSLCKELI